MRRTKKKQCSIPGCENLWRSRGVCNKHYIALGKAGQLPPLLTVKDRFSDKYQIDKKSGCWNWIGNTTKGYGRFQWEGKMVMATHVSLYLVGEEMPGENYYACHKCDNPSCVNPEHLFWGTARDNSLDMISKGREPRGENRGNSKLTNDEVLTIKHRMPVMSDRALGRMFSVSSACIAKIRAGETWRWLNG